MNLLGNKVAETYIRKGLRTGIVWLIVCLFVCIDIGGRGAIISGRGPYNFIGLSMLLVSQKFQHLFDCGSNKC